jgi:hypothetical protein
VVVVVLHIGAKSDLLPAPDEALLKCIMGWLPPSLTEHQRGREETDPTHAGRSPVMPRLAIAFLHSAWVRISMPAGQEDAPYFNFWYCDTSPTVVAADQHPPNEPGTKLKAAQSAWNRQAALQLSTSRALAKLLTK